MKNIFKKRKWLIKKAWIKNHLHFGSKGFLSGAVSEIKIDKPDDVANDTTIEY